MSYCAYCGSQINDRVSFCPNCGAKQENADSAAAATRPVSPAPQQTYQQQTYQQPAYQQQTYNPPYPAVPQVSTGGLMAWSIITLLLCTIPGIIALCKIGKIKQATTVEEQNKAIKSVKTWCIVGTIIGVLALMGAVGNALG